MLPEVKPRTKNIYKDLATGDFSSVGEDVRWEVLSMKSIKTNYQMQNNWL